MNGKPAKRSSLFLMELIIAILFFSLASAVCIRFFVKSHTLSQDTEHLNMAVNQVSGCAELFLSCEESMRSASDTYFDKNWTACGKSDAAYVLSTSIREKDRIQIGTFSVKAADGDEVIYTLDVKKYIGSGNPSQEVIR